MKKIKPSSNFNGSADNFPTNVLKNIKTRQVAQRKPKIV